LPEFDVNRIKIDPERVLGPIDRNIFGGFAEHLGRCIYGGLYEPGSPLADARGLRRDVLQALLRLRMPVIRYPGGNFASGYRWMDGVGPRAARPSRSDLAWGAVDSNQFGTNEFMVLCKKLKAEPYLVANCGDGDLREARDWVEYCNGFQDSALVRLRHKHGFIEPHNVKYWGMGNEVDGQWQIGYKTPQEYARDYTEFAKVMKWADPRIKLIASAISDWEGDIVERTQLLLEQAYDLIDYLSIHWYVGNPNGDFAEYMSTSELLEDRIKGCEGLIRAMALERNHGRRIAIAVDEWNIWYRTHPKYGGVPSANKLEEIYNLEDALVAAMNLNAFIRNSRSIKMANLAQIVNVIAPIFANSSGHFLQTIFFPFELYSTTCGTTALDAWWDGDTFSGGKYSALRALDVSATLNEARREVAVYIVNRSAEKTLETELTLAAARYRGTVRVAVINGPNIKSENTFQTPNQVQTSQSKLVARGQSLRCVFEPHSVTSLRFAIA
jgi:alpha-N-arabinofuranosidase